MRRVLAVSLAFSLLYIPLLEAQPSANSSTPSRISPQDQQDQEQGNSDQEQGAYVPYSDDQLDNLLAPIALYPDPLLAQVLLAATFPDDVDAAARYVRSYGQNGIDDQNWDVSVKAVAHYPSVLYMMSDRIDWTTAVGQAYVNQSTDVMSSVQRLRQMARAQGNLVTGPQDEVVDQDGYIQIWPANPQYIYVPQYDPAVVYYSRPFWGAAITFGAGFIIGAWLNNDCDWRDHRVFYTGWQGGGWVQRSRPYVHITNVYVNNRYTNIRVNRTVVNRQVNFNNVNRFNNVHRNVTFDNHARPGNVPRPENRVSNQIINRNIPNNARVDQFRGRVNQPQPVQPIERPMQSNENVRPAQRPPQPPPQQTYRPPPQQTYRPTQQQQRPAPPPAEQSGPHAFGRNEGNFPPRQASQRGQESRASRPSPPPRPAPSRPSAPSRPAPSRPSGNPGRPGRPR
jgi:hypothetical protein